MKKKVVVLAASALLALTSVMPVMAQEVTTGTVEITGGNLSIVPQAITFEGVTLSGAAQSGIAGSTTAWTVTDPTGTGAGWTVTIQAGDFEKTTDPTKTIPASGFKASLSDIDTIAGNAPPTSSLAGASLDQEQVLVSAAAGEGMGTYKVTPTFTLDVPVDTYAGTYEATVTLTISAGPQ